MKNATNGAPTRSIAEAVRADRKRMTDFCTNRRIGKKVILYQWLNLMQERSRVRFAQRDPANGIPSETAFWESSELAPSGLPRVDKMGVVGGKIPGEDTRVPVRRRAKKGDRIVGNRPADRREGTT